MELFAKRMTWELNNEEGLSCLFFELEDGYFTLSRKTGAEALRLDILTAYLPAILLLFPLVCLLTLLSKQV